MSKEDFKEYSILGKTITYEEHKIKESKQYLKDTDYCIIKMYEEVVQGGSIIEMLKEYKEILSKRKEARQLINELEKEMSEENGN